MRHRALKRRYGRSRGRALKWNIAPDGSAYTITAGGTIYTVLHDRHKRKWTLLGSDGFLGSAIRRRDAQRIAERIEGGA